MKKLATLSLVLLLTTSCSAQWGKGVKGNGKKVTVDRTVSEYDALAVSGWFDVDLVEGKEGELTLEGEENLLEYIITEVENGKLIIKVEKGVNLKPSSSSDGIRITVPVESIDAVSMSGSGDIVGKKTIKSSNFKTAMSGSGDITLDIETESITAAMSGSGDMNLSGSTRNFEATSHCFRLCRYKGYSQRNVESKGFRFRGYQLSWQSEKSRYEDLRLRRYFKRIIHQKRVVILFLGRKAR